MINIDLLKHREFFLKGWLFTKKKVNAVIEVCTEQVLVVIKSELTILKKTFVVEASNEVKTSFKVQFEKLASQITEVKVQNQRLMGFFQEVQHTQKVQSETLAQLQ